MSKSDGLKIGIKFTQELVGDVSGNESAFTITGKEYSYINGILVDKEYQIEVVKKYPAPTLYEDDFTDGDLINVVINNNGFIELGVDE